MPLTEKAYLEVEDGNGTGVFELQIELEHTSALSKNYIMGERGQYVREIVTQTLGLDIALDQAVRRTGFWLDGGAGNWEETVEFSAGGPEDITWGDGDGGDGPSNVTTRDASGADVDPLTRMQILQYWLARTRSDSLGYSRMHWGEWTDGSYPESAAGAFEMPMPVAITETNFTNPHDDTTVFNGSITMSHPALMPAATPDLASWAETAIQSGNTPLVTTKPDGVLDR